MPKSSLQTKIFDEIVAERDRQNAKWGEQNHDPFTYMTVLTEEVGEAAEAALHMKFGGPEAENYRTELVQIAAVAVEMIECVDRKKGGW
jgi:NTP pyrophosphatase (non-canonical NTP hydrolase)